jgi:hypothetical protein
MFDEDYIAGVLFTSDNRILTLSICTKLLIFQGMFTSMMALVGYLIRAVLDSFFLLYMVSDNSSVTMMVRKANIFQPSSGNEQKSYKTYFKKSHAEFGV